MTIKICVSISPETVSEALDLVERAEDHGADFIEVRLDNFEKNGELRDVANCGRVPMIATNRSIECGGRFSGSETERKQILLRAAGSGFEYVDVELSTSGLKDIVGEMGEMGVKPIISFHDFNKTPSLSLMSKILKREIKSGADVCKIIATAKSIDDNLTVLNFVSKTGKSNKTICFAMGEMGKSSRLLSPLFGAFFTIASLQSGRETAPGQLTIQEMRALYKTLGLV